MPSVVDLFVAGAGSEPMKPVESVEAIAAIEDASGIDHRFRIGDAITDVTPLDRTDEIVERLRSTGETRR